MPLPEGFWWCPMTQSDCKRDDCLGCECMLLKEEWARRKGHDGERLAPNPDHPMVPESPFPLVRKKLF